MKKPIIGRIIVLALGMLASQFVKAQGTVTYLSNLGQPFSSSFAVGSDSWIAMPFYTGNNSGGYSFNSVQLAMSTATGDPNGFSVMLYGEKSSENESPGNDLGSLSGSSSPVSAGTYSYAPVAAINLSPFTVYYIVLTSDTTTANGAYNWSLANNDNFTQNGGWLPATPAGVSAYNSANGSSWNGSFINPEAAISATPTPEPGVMSLLGMGGLIFGLCRWKKF